MRTPLTWIEKATGIFVVIMLAIVGLAAFTAAQRNNMFSTKKDFKIQTFIDKGYGITIGTTVSIRNVPAGVVTDLEFVTVTARPKEHKDDRPIMLTMRIDGQFPSFLSSDTHVELEQQPIGATKIELWTDLAGLDEHALQPLENGATIDCKVLESLFEKLGKIKDDVTAVKDDVLKTLKNVQDIIANVKTSTDAIARGEGTVGRVIHDQKMAQDVADTVASTRALVIDLQTNVMVDVKTATANAARATADIPAVVADAKGLVEDLRGTVKTTDEALAPLPETMAGVARALRDVEVIVANLRTASGGFPEIARKTDHALEETNRTIDAVQRSFLLRGNMAERAAVRSEAEALPRGGQE